MPASIEKRPYGTTAAGAAVHEYTLRNANGMIVKIINFGGIITSLSVPNRRGEFGNIVLGLNSLAEYETQKPYLGALIGRFGNRIGGASFTLGDQTYRLPANDGGNSLHGGNVGFDRVVWTAEEIPGDAEVGLKLTHVSPDGDQGFPGTLSVTVAYTLTAANALRVDYTATTDKPTVVNLTQHTYFNLAGNGAGTVYDHVMWIDAEQITAIGPGLIPTGALLPVEGTPFDFRVPKAIGAQVRSSHPQMILGRGYDHNWVLRRIESDTLGTPQLAARVHELSSGRILEVLTTEPGVQFYSGNFLDGTLVGSSGGTYRQGDGLCLETQHYPDSPNHPEFPTTTLNPGETYQTTTIFRFRTD